MTPLYIAAAKGYEQIVQILLEKGANVVLPKRVSLFYSHFENFFFVVANYFHFFSFFFSYFRFYERMEEPPLQIAAKKGHELIVQILLEKGANVDFPWVFFLFF